MPFSFPSNPSIGALSTQNSREYRYAGNNTWELVAASSTDSRWDLFLPPAPTSLTATGGNAQASLSWTAPTVLAQTPITDYTVQFSSNSGSTWTTFTRAASTSTSATVTGLTNGTAYVFRVAAVNGVGTGSYSSASSSVTPAVPPVITIGTQPSNQTASSGAATFSVSASVTQSATLSYQWQRSTNSGSTFTAISGATSSSLALTGLVAGDNGYQYRVVVSATGGATSVTSSAATLTVSSGPVFSDVSWYSNASSATLSVSGNTITINKTGAFGDHEIAFTMPAGTLTITKTSGGLFGSTLSVASSALPGGNANLPYLSKDSRWYGFVPNNANSASLANMPAAPYRWAIFDSNVPATYTLVLS